MLDRTRTCTLYLLLAPRTTAPVESHLPGLGPFPATRVETCVSSLGACAVPSPGATEGFCVGAAATTSLVSAFGARSRATSQTAQLFFSLDSGVSSCFFRDCTDLTPLRTPVTVALADPSVGPVVARSTNTLPCPVAPSGFLTGYYTPSFSRNLVDVNHLHDLSVVTTFPLDEPVASYTVSATGTPLATFHREPGSGLYSLHTGSRHIGSGLPHSLAPLPRSPAPSCTPCVEGRQCAAPHSSSFPPTMAPIQTLHFDVWGPSPVLGPRQERYFLIVVDDYSRYTMVFPLRQKADVPTVLEPWLLARGGVQALCGLCLHSDRGGEFSSTRLETFCQGRGIIQFCTLPASPQQNGVAEQRITLVMEVARTSMCHAGAPQFLLPQAVRYAAHQLNMWPSDARPRMTPISLWTGSPGVENDFRVWGSLAHVRTPGANKLSPRTRACVFLDFPLDSAGWVFYNPLTYEFFNSQDVTFDESVCYCRSHPHRGTEVFPPPLFLTLEPPTVAPVAPPPPFVSCPVRCVACHSAVVPPVVSSPCRVSRGAGGAVAEGEGAGAAGAGGVGSRGAGGVGMEVTPVEDTAASTRRPRPASPPSFPSVPQFPPRSSLWPVAAEHGVFLEAPGVSVVEVLVLGGIAAAAAAAAAAVAAAAGAVSVTAAGESRGGATAAAAKERVEEDSRPHQERVEQESRRQQQVQLQTQQERVEEESRPQQERVAQKSRLQQRVQLQPQKEREEEPQEQQQGQVLSQQTPEESLSSSQWTRRSLLSGAVSPKPRRSRYRVDGPFHLVLRSRVPPPPILSQPPESSLIVLHDPLSDYLRASRLVVSRVLSTLVTHPTAPLSSVSALVTTVAGFASSHRLD
ncbi:unnamed protein product [Closterium sp. NIES-53]